MQRVKLLKFAADEDGRAIERVPRPVVNWGRFRSTDGEQRHFPRHGRIGLVQIQQGQADGGRQRPGSHLADP